MSVATVQTELRGAVFTLLAADATLETLLGPGRLFDAAPRGQNYPYLVLEAVESRPLLADFAHGAVHDLTLTVFSRAESRDEAAEAAGRAAEILGFGPVVLGAYRLVNLTLTNIITKRLRDGRGFRASCALRAVTEPLN